MTNTQPATPRKPRIAIAGATGRVGSTLTRLLAADPVDLVALTRRPEEAHRQLGIGATPIDFRAPRTIVDALQDTDRLFIAHGTSPDQVADEIALIDAAVAAGVGHVVKLSAMGPATRLNPLAWHLQIETHLSRQSIASTTLRPSAFADMLLRFAPEIRTGSWQGAAGNGRVNFIDTRDVAEVARLALLEEVLPESQRVYHITGPRAWSMQQLATEFSNHLGFTVTYASRSLAEQRAALLQRGVAPFVAELLVGLEQAFRDSVLAETTATFEELTGKPPRQLHDWLAENVATFSKA